MYFNKSAYVSCNNIEITGWLLSKGEYKLLFKKSWKKKNISYNKRHFREVEKG